MIYSDRLVGLMPHFCEQIEPNCDDDVKRNTLAFITSKDFDIDNYVVDNGFSFKKEQNVIDKIRSYQKEDNRYKIFLDIVIKDNFNIFYFHEYYKWESDINH